ncbi:MAG: histidine kinase, partial [Sciscionella sp.]
MEPVLATRTLSASTEIVTAALAGDEPDEVLQLAVRSAAELVEADLGLVMARGTDDRLTVEAAHGDRRPLDEDPVGIVLSARSSAAKAARGDVPIVAENFTVDPRTAPYVPEALRGYGPFVVTPFGTRQRRLGALAVYRRRGRPPFTDSDAEVLTAFAAQAGLVLVLAEGATARQRVALYQERERIARDLHDVIVQQLYATGMQLDLLSRGLSGPEAAKLDEAVEALDTTIGEIRAAVRELRSADPAESEPVALFESVRVESATAGGLLGFEPKLELSGDNDIVPGTVADHARAALREALSNVVRHSGARKVAVLVHIGGGQLLLRVSDDGCGIPPGVARRGLRHLEERATAAGGWCS